MGCFATVGVTGWLAQRVAANEALARQRGRALATQTRVNQLVIQDMQDGVLVLDREGRVLQHNPQAQRLLAAERLLGAGIAELLPGFGARWRAWRTGDAAAGGPADLALLGRDIRLRLLDTGTDEQFSVVFIEDMTRTREQAQQIKLAALGRLTANIAHEIRNPLAAISHAAELLDEENRGGDRERLTRIVHDNTQRLERLVAEVLQLNRRDRISAERIRLDAWLPGFIAEFVANESVPAARLGIGAAREAWGQFARVRRQPGVARIRQRHAGSAFQDRDQGGARRMKRAERRAASRGASVLVVDDEPDIRELLELTLVKMGLDVESVGSIAEAKERLKSDSYDLCLTDMRLADGEGLE